MEFLHESAAAFGDRRIVYRVVGVFPKFFSIQDGCFTENFEVMGNRRLGEMDFFHNAVCIYLFVALDDIQNHLTLAVMDSLEKYIPLFGTRTVHRKFDIDIHLYDTTYVLFCHFSIE